MTGDTVRRSALAALIVVVGMAVVATPREEGVDDSALWENGVGQQVARARYGTPQFLWFSATSPGPNRDNPSHPGYLSQLHSSREVEGGLGEPTAPFPELVYETPEVEAGLSSVWEATQLDGTLLQPSDEIRGNLLPVTITAYVCTGAPEYLDDGYCGAMRNGEQVHEGAAACGSDLPRGTRFRILGDPLDRVYECEDTGYLGRNQIDVWFFDWAEAEAWLAQTETQGMIEVLP